MKNSQKIIQGLMNGYEASGDDIETLGALLAHGLMQVKPDEKLEQVQYTELALRLVEYIDSVA